MPVGYYLAYLEIQLYVWIGMLGDATAFAVGVDADTRI